MSIALLRSYIPPEQCKYCTIKNMCMRHVVLFFLAKITLFSSDLDLALLERQCKDLLFTKRPSNDYDFIDTYQANFVINVNLRDQIKIHADRCVYEYSGIMRFDCGVKIEYYDEMYNCVFTVTANKAFLNIKRGVWFFYGYVDIVSFGHEKKEIYTDYVYYMQEEKILFNNSYLKISSDNMNISGNGIVIKDQMSYYKILSPHITYIR